jgi:hypothetical protein
MPFVLLSIVIFEFYSQVSSLILKFCLTFQSLDGSDFHGGRSSFCPFIFSLSPLTWPWLKNDNSQLPIRDPAPGNDVSLHS